jgi:hypothetical protein
MPEKLKYEPAVIESHAAMLYLRAEQLIARLAALGALVGIVIGGFGGVVVGGAGVNAPLLVGVLLGGLLGAAIGKSIGTGRAFMLQLAAQTALCQVAIERNTRPPT